MKDTKYYCDVCGAEIYAFYPDLEEASITVEHKGVKYQFSLHFCEKHTGDRESFGRDIRKIVLKGLQEKKGLMND